ncbi:hypothetical protein HD554DRAFT_2037165 [Boletus coccyginus]|nr:hypothetical protein HD554DRAFT_2037165 [Boletus coccyginus]
MIHPLRVQESDYDHQVPPERSQWCPRDDGCHRVASLKETVFRFDGNVIPADVMLEKRAWSTGRYFVGPDRHTYKWKLESTHCWLKPSESDVHLVRFHKKNLGILKESHPAYLDVSPEAVPMLDHVVLTSVYVESLRQKRLRERGGLTT